MFTRWLHRRKKVGKLLDSQLKFCIFISRQIRKDRLGRGYLAVCVKDHRQLSSPHGEYAAAIGTVKKGCFEVRFRELWHPFFPDFKGWSLTQGLHIGERVSPTSPVTASMLSSFTIS
jgi:hypothetical protein